MRKFASYLTVTLCTCAISYGDRSTLDPTKTQMALPLENPPTIDGVIELTDPVDMRATTDAAVAAGVWLRPFRNLVYTMPPYICSSDDLAAITSGMIAAVGANAR